jgi:2,4-dienoyl-CoA reductase-like NADH-dependent reductase (Old Yellow Enzyme family)
MGDLRQSGTHAMRWPPREGSSPLTTGAARPLLFTPIDLRGVRAANRIVISPMCQYSAEDGMPNDWHLVHLGRFATGGAGIVFTEATAVEARGRITHGDLGLWDDAQIAAHRRITGFVKAHGARAGLQLGHAGRKASMQRPWFGNGPLDEHDIARGEMPWPIVGPSPVPVAEGWLVPHELTAPEIAAVVRGFAATAERAVRAGYDILEIHGAHGYLIHSFLSPVANRRTDAYGGGCKGRMRLALEASEAVRAAWPEDRPLFFRVSAVDGVEGGWNLEDTVALARELKALGVDVIDCSSSGIGGAATAAGVRRQAGYQVPYAETVRREAGIMTQAVGLITHPRQAEAILERGQADLIAIGRDALQHPHWPRDAAEALGVDTAFELWPEQYSWWLSRRARSSDFYRDEAAGDRA